MTEGEAAVWEFARQFARTSGDSPSCECVSCRAYRAVHLAPSPVDQQPAARAAEEER